MDLIKFSTIEELLKGKFDGKLVSCNVERLTAGGENYLSLLLKVDVQYATNGFKPKESVLHLVAKVSSSEFLKFGPFNPQALFEKEISWYSVVVPLLKEFGKSYDVEEFADLYPKYFNGKVPKSNYEEDLEHSVLLLENVAEEYKNYDRTVGFDYKTSKLILKNLARFHSLSIGLKAKKSQLFEKRILPVLNVVPFREKPSVPNIQNGSNGIESSFEEVVTGVLSESHEHARYIERTKEALRKSVAKHKGIREPWATACHNDFWTNNILIKKENNKPTKIKMIDFQTTSYGSLTADLVFFLFTSLKTSVLQTQLFDELLRYYHVQLIQNLKQLKLKTEEYSYENYLEEIKTETCHNQYGHTVTMLNFIYGKQTENTSEGSDRPQEMNFQRFFEKIKDITPAHKERLLAVTDVCVKRNWI